MSILFIIEFIAALTVLIFLHEFGHFLVCKALHIEVEEFGFGLPPRILTLFEYHGTKYTLNALPIGGFVRPKGELDPEVSGGLGAASPWKRIAVPFAGPIMNILTAVVMFFAIYAIIGQIPDRNHVMLASIEANSPAANAGLQVGDILVSVGGVPIHSIDTVMSEISANLGKPLQFVYERGGTTHDVTLTPLVNPPPNMHAVGIGMDYPRLPFTIWRAIPESFATLVDYCKQLFSFIGQLVRGQTSSSQGGLVGVVGMYQLYAGVVQSSADTGIPVIANVLAFFASISISLGIMNLLPIPALDGGLILFTIPELFTHRRIPAKYEQWVNMISLLLLIMLMIYINLSNLIHPVSITP